MMSFRRPVARLGLTSTHLPANGSAIRAGEHQTGHAVGQSYLMEIENQSERHVEQFYIAHELGLVDGYDLLDGFDFNQQAVLDKQVEAKRLLSRETLVVDDDEAMACPNESDRMGPPAFHQFQVPYFVI
jgi:hypothetical protein